LALSTQDEQCAAWASPNSTCCVLHREGVVPPSVFAAGGASGLRGGWSGDEEVGVLTFAAAQPARAPSPARGHFSMASGGPGRMLTAPSLAEALEMLGAEGGPGDAKDPPFSPWHPLGLVAADFSVEAGGAEAQAQLSFAWYFPDRDHLGTWRLAWFASIGTVIRCSHALSSMPGLEPVPALMMVVVMVMMMTMTTMMMMSPHLLSPMRRRDAGQPLRQLVGQLGGRGNGAAA
jgi:hypothetical protein